MNRIPGKGIDRDTSLPLVNRSSNAGRTNSVINLSSSTVCATASGAAPLSGWKALYSSVETVHSIGVSPAFQAPQSGTNTKTPISSADLLTGLIAPANQKSLPGGVTPEATSTSGGTTVTGVSKSTVVDVVRGQGGSPSAPPLTLFSTLASGASMSAAAATPPFSSSKHSSPHSSRPPRHQSSFYRLQSKFERRLTGRSDLSDTAGNASSPLGAAATSRSRSLLSASRSCQTLQSTPRGSPIIGHKTIELGRGEGVVPSPLLSPLMVRPLSSVEEVVSTKRYASSSGAATSSSGGSKPVKHSRRRTNSRGSTAAVATNTLPMFLPTPTTYITNGGRSAAKGSNNNRNNANTNTNVSSLVQSSFHRHHSDSITSQVVYSPSAALGLAHPIAVDHDDVEALRVANKDSSNTFSRATITGSGSINNIVVSAGGAAITPAWRVAANSPTAVTTTTHILSPGGPNAIAVPFANQLQCACPESQQPTCKHTHKLQQQQQRQQHSSSRRGGDGQHSLTIPNDLPSTSFCRSVTVGGMSTAVPMAQSDRFSRAQHSTHESQEYSNRSSNSALLAISPAGRSINHPLEVSFHANTTFDQDDEDGNQHSGGGGGGGTASVAALGGANSNNNKTLRGAKAILRKRVPPMGASLRSSRGLSFHRSQSGIEKRSSIERRINAGNDDDAPLGGAGLMSNGSSYRLKPLSTNFGNSFRHRRGSNGSHHAASPLATNYRGGTVQLPLFEMMSTTSCVSEIESVYVDDAGANGRGSGNPNLSESDGRSTRVTAEQRRSLQRHTVMQETVENVAVKSILQFNSSRAGPNASMDAAAGGGGFAPVQRYLASPQSSPRLNLSPNGPTVVSAPSPTTRQQPQLPDAEGAGGTRFKRDQFLGGAGASTRPLTATILDSSVLSVSSSADSEDSRYHQQKVQEVLMRLTFNQSTTTGNNNNNTNTDGSVATAAGGDSENANSGTAGSTGGGGVAGDNGVVSSWAGIGGGLCAFGSSVVASGAGNNSASAWGGAGDAVVTSGEANGWTGIGGNGGGGSSDDWYAKMRLKVLQDEANEAAAESYKACAEDEDVPRVGISSSLSDTNVKIKGEEKEMTSTSTQQMRSSLALEEMKSSADDLHSVKVTESPKPQGIMVSFPRRTSSGAAAPVISSPTTASRVTPLTHQPSEERSPLGMRSPSSLHRGSRAKAKIRDAPDSASGSVLRPQPPKIPRRAATASGSNRRVTHQQATTPTVEAPISSSGATTAAPPLPDGSTPFNRRSVVPLQAGKKPRQQHQTESSYQMMTPSLIIPLTPVVKSGSHDGAGLYSKNTSMPVKRGGADGVNPLDPLQRVSATPTGAVRRASRRPSNTRVHNTNAPPTASSKDNWIDAGTPVTGTTGKNNTSSNTITSASAQGAEPHPREGSNLISGHIVSASRRSSLQSHSSIRGCSVAGSDASLHSATGLSTGAAAGRGCSNGVAHNPLQQSLHRKTSSGVGTPLCGGGDTTTSSSPNDVSGGSLTAKLERMDVIGTTRTAIVVTRDSVEECGKCSRVASDDLSFSPIAHTAR